MLGLPDRSAVATRSPLITSCRPEVVMRAARQSWYQGWKLNEGVARFVVHDAKHRSFS